MKSVTQDTKFADPIRISQIEDDISVVVAQWGPAYRDTTHEFFVRKVPVSRTTITKEHDGRLYRYCLFLDGRTMLVNEGNIRSRKIIRGYSTNG